MSGVGLAAAGASWVWSTFGLVANVYDGASAVVANYGPPLLQGAKQGGMKILETVGGTGLLLGNVAVRGVGYAALGVGAVGAAVGGAAVGGAALVGGAVVGGAMGAVGGAGTGAVTGAAKGAVTGAVEGAVKGAGVGFEAGSARGGVGAVVGGAVGGVVGGAGGAVVGAVAGATGGAVTGAVTGAVEGAVKGAVSGASIGAVGAKAVVGGGVATAGNILDLSDQVGRMTVVGRLPNRPGFEDALAEKGVALDAQYRQVLAAQNGAGPVHAALTALDNALAGANATQAGQPVAMAAQDFHAALALGGHFVKQDGGALYNALHGIQGMQARSSSHYKAAQAQQYGMDLPGGLGHLLIGQTPGGDTFFQLESHGLGNPNQSAVEKLLEGIGHTMAYVQHISGAAQYVQIGPGGCIAASEKDGQHVVLT